VGADHADRARRFASRSELTHRSHRRPADRPSLHGLSSPSTLALIDSWRLVLAVRLRLAFERADRLRTAHAKFTFDRLGWFFPTSSPDG